MALAPIYPAWQVSLLSGSLRTGIGRNLTKNRNRGEILGRSKSDEKCSKERRWLDQGFLESANSLPQRSDVRLGEIGPRRGRFFPSIPISWYFLASEAARPLRYAGQLREGQNRVQVGPTWGAHRASRPAATFHPELRLAGVRAFVNALDRPELTWENTLSKVKPRSKPIQLATREASPLQNQRLAARMSFLIRQGELYYLKLDREKTRGFLFRRPPAKRQAVFRCHGGLLLLSRSFKA